MGRTSMTVTAAEVVGIRRVAFLVSSVLCVVAAGATLYLGYSMAAVGEVVGVCYGMWMFTSLIATALGATELDLGTKAIKKRIMGSRGLRLFALTAGVLVMMLAVPQMGFGTIGGLVIFQIVMLGTAARTVSASAHAAMNPSTTNSIVTKSHEKGL